MIAWITRLLIIAQVIFAAASGYAVYLWAGTSIASSVLWGVLIVVLVRMAIVGNNFRIASRFWKKNKWTADLGPSHVFRMFLHEFVASMWSSSWTMPFGRRTWGNSHATEALPVVLVHGYACNSGYWYSMRRALESAGIRHEAVDLEPVFGDIDDYLPEVDRAVNAAMEAAGGKPVVIVGHSMGGLVARAYLRRYGFGRIARIITIGTPHNGTVLARYSAGSNCKQMCHDATNGRCSDWLESLEKSHGREERELTTSIYSRHDNIIAPQGSCHLIGGKNIAFDGIGHVELGCHPAVHASVIEEIKEAGTGKMNGADAEISIANRQNKS